jgi:AcrR family transcriptional regulator
MTAKRAYSEAVQQKREAMIGQIVAAATRRFNRQGFSNTTMEDVGSDVSLLPGALYHYVRDKDELAYLCLVHGCEVRAGQLEAADERGVDGLEKVRRYLRSVLRTGQSRIPGVQRSQRADGPPPRRRRARIRRNNDQLRRYLAEGMADGAWPLPTPV